jgi:type I restriction enzyme S subunit
MKELRIKFRWETEFKETEIGEMPREWEMSKIGVFYKLKYGITANSGEFGNCRLLRQTDLKEGFIDISSVPYSEVSEDEIQKYLLKDDDLVISRIANVGSIGYVSFEALNSLDKPLIFGSYLLKFEKIKEIHNKFTFYFLLSSQMQDYIKSIADGSTRQNTNAKVVAEFPLYVPPLPEQSRIATVLSWFDDLIEVKKRQNEILEKTAMAIFKSWFIDFEPFRDGEFVYSEELGKEIPKGWEVDKTTKLIDYNPSVSIEEGKIFPFVEMKDVSTNSLICDFSFKTFTGSGVSYFGGDTLMARITPSLEHGKTAFVWFISEKEKGFGSTEFFVLHPKKSYLKEFVYLLAKSNNFRETAINSMSGTSGRQRADINALKNYLIPIPPSHILQSFHSLVEPLFQKIILNQKQIMTLRRIRDTLLPLLVFGKLRVEEV